MKVLGKTVKVWKGPFVCRSQRRFKISLCTTCMGRLRDLTQTFLKNILDNRDYTDVEFVLLDYNSQDGLEDWAKANLTALIEEGRCIYAKTTEPDYYSMAHSRNVAFKLATGEIVCNVDADNWTGPGFASFLNQLGNECPEKALFARGRQLLRGRIGFFKSEWHDVLGGYDERLQGYGHDDWDLVNRALLQDFTLMPFGGAFISRIATSGSERTDNMKEKSWRATEKLNRELSHASICAGALKSNLGKRWGAAKVVKNFSETVVL